MKFDVSSIVGGKFFSVYGMSYIGAPRSNTAMFVSKKVEHLIEALDCVSECLVFAETSCNVSEQLSKKHAFCFTDTPQLDFARFATKFAQERFYKEKALNFNLTSDGFYLSEDSIIGENAYIEPGCFIGPDVKIGKNAKIFAGTVIKHSSIGNDFIANENSVIGSFGFTMTEDDSKNKIRIPTLGNVIIGNNVEVGAHNNISCGSCGDTIIGNNVKLDSLVHVGHDVQLRDNVEVTAGVTIGGFVILEQGTYVGISSVLKNRITIGACSFIGMGACVTKSFEAQSALAGNPARKIIRN